MLPEVHLGRHCCAPSTNPDNYRPLVGDALIDEIQTLAKDLRGVRVCQINATAAGGGVAEFLGRQIPPASPAYAPVPGDHPARLQMADLVGISHWPGRELFVGRLHRPGLYADLQLLP